LRRAKYWSSTVMAKTRLTMDDSNGIKEII